MNARPAEVLTLILLDSDLPSTVIPNNFGFTSRGEQNTKPLREKEKLLDVIQEQRKWQLINNLTKKKTLKSRRNTQQPHFFKIVVLKERKLQANITDEHRCKNPQQNTSKQNPTAY